MQPEVRDQILRRIDTYDGSIKGLGRIVAELDAIWSAEDWQPPDSQRFYSTWLTMETIYALALDRGDQDLKPNDQDDIASALAAIRPIIQKGPQAESGL